MRKIRLVAKLEIKGRHVIKGVHMEGLRVVGDPAALCRRYFHDGIDEIVLIDTVASLYERDYLVELISQVADELFIPLVVGGGLRTLEDLRRVFRAGADKVAINTQAVKSPVFLREASAVFGAQSIILSVHAKQRARGGWEAYCENARQPTRLDVVDWVKQATAFGAGEILLSSIDADGTMRGMDRELCRVVSESVAVPVIASGGVGSSEDIVSCVKQSRVSAVAVAAALHFQRESVQTLKGGLRASGIDVRESPPIPPMLSPSLNEQASVAR